MSGRTDDSMSERLLADDSGQQHQEQACQVCNSNPIRYRCPRCSKQTCSLQCVNAHKRQTGCTGKRDRTGYIKRVEFDDRTMLSDYKFLEEAKLVQEVAKRAKPPTPRFQLPPHLQSLVYQASRKGVTLQIMSPGMERRRVNSTRYDGRNKTLSWRVEWDFVKAGCKAVNARVADNKVLWDLLQAHLNPPPGETLKYPALHDYAKVGMDGMVIALRKENTSANEPRYYQIHPNSTVEDALKDKVVIEYPVFLVLLGDDIHSYQFENLDNEVTNSTL